MEEQEKKKSIFSRSHQRGQDIPGALTYHQAQDEKRHHAARLLAIYQNLILTCCSAETDTLPKVALLSAMSPR